MQSRVVAYKILTAGQWAALCDGRFTGSPVDQADGYIHLSTDAQLAGTLERHFAGQQDLIIAAIDLLPFGDAVRWEPSRRGELFPHLYAPLTRAAVIGSYLVQRDPTGKVHLRPDAAQYFGSGVTQPTSSSRDCGMLIAPFCGSRNPNSS